MCCSKCLLRFYLYRVWCWGCFVFQPIPPPSFTLPVLPSPRGGWFVVYVGVWLGGWGSSASGGHLCVDGVCEAHVERVVVLHQGGLVVVEHQVLQAAVQVVGLSEAEAARCAVDHAVLHLTFDAVETERGRSQHRWLFSASTANFPSVFSLISSRPTAQTGRLKSPSPQNISASPATSVV